MRGLAFTWRGSNPSWSLPSSPLKLSQLWLREPLQLGARPWTRGLGLRAPPLQARRAHLPPGPRAGFLLRVLRCGPRSGIWGPGCGIFTGEGDAFCTVLMWSGACAFTLTGVFAVCGLGARVGDNQLLSDEGSRGCVDTAGHRPSVPDLALLHGVGSWAWRCLKPFQTHERSPRPVSSFARGQGSG